MKTLIIALLMATTAVAQESQNFPISSVFASEIPAVQKGQHVLQTHEYLACIDPERRQPVWVAYHVEQSDHDTQNVLSRNFSTPDRYKDISLESSDYSANGWADQGHMIPLASKSASRHAFEVNWMMVIAIQDSDLNRGPWLKLENRVRELAEKNDDVEVLAFCLFEGEQRKLKNSDEPHEAPSHCGMIIRSESDGVECYLIPQGCQRSDTPEKFRMELDELKPKISDVWWKSK